MLRFALSGFVLWTIIIYSSCVYTVSGKQKSDPGEPLYLTPLIKAGEIDMAQELARFSGKYFATTDGYSGYITINDQYNSNMFFMYLPATFDHKNTPVIVWVGDGPSMSSLYGVLFESGPITINENDDVDRNKYSWNSNYNMIYIDTPVGTGYSFTEDDAGYARSDEEVGKQLYNTLTQLYILFPELEPLPLYVAGNSYAGKFAIALAHILHRAQGTRSVVSPPPFVPTRFSGLIIGNGLQDPIAQLHFGYNLYNIGLLDDHGLENFDTTESVMDECMDQYDIACSLAMVYSLMSIGSESGKESLFSNLTHFERNTNSMFAEADVRPDLMAHHVTTSGFRKLIHVGNNPFHPFSDQSNVVRFLLNSSLQSVAPWTTEILDNYPVCLYFGQTDIILPYRVSIQYIQTLNFQGAKAYREAKRQIWWVDDDVAGYAKRGGNLLEVLVRNAGHRASGDQPKWILDMLVKFIKGENFEKPTG